MTEYSRQIVGIIPAAGKGTRLYPFPCPKELFPVGFQDFTLDGVIQKRPKVISQYVIENIIRAGAERIFIILGDDKHDIMRYYGDGSYFGAGIAYLYQEKLKGMPYALNLARDWLVDNTVLFGMPDTIVEPKNVFQRLIQFHQQEQADLTLGLFHTQNPSKFGMVEFDESLDITFIIDKPQQTDLTYMWGCACWSPRFTKLLDDFLRANPYKGKEAVLGDVFTHAIENGLRVKGLPFDDGQYIDIGTADELDMALKKFHL